MWKITNNSLAASCPLLELSGVATHEEETTLQNVGKKECEGVTTVSWGSAFCDFRENAR